MAAFRFINMLLVVAALALSAAAAYVFFGRTGIDEAEKRLSRYEMRIDAEIPLAQAGDINAQYKLGRLYRFGEGRTRNLKRAVKWLRGAAKGGHGGAQYELGQMYAKGQGVSQSYYRAVEWFSLAARVSNHRSAQFALGELYFLGRGVDRDFIDARKWLLMAAIRNHPLAQYYIGQLYEKGWGGETNYIEAFKWYTLASRKVAEIKSADAKYDPNGALANLRTRLNRSQLAAGQKAVEHWKAAH